MPQPISLGEHHLVGGDHGDGQPGHAEVLERTLDHGIDVGKRGAGVVGDRHAARELEGKRAAPLSELAANLVAFDGTVEDRLAGNTDDREADRVSVNRELAQRQVGGVLRRDADRPREVAA